MERYGEFFLADLQGGIGLLKLAICVLLNRERMLGFKMYQFLESLLGCAIDQINECEGDQQSHQAGDRQNGKQLAQVRLKLPIGLRPSRGLELQEIAHLHSN